jgi:hypothetical protein
MELRVSHSRTEDWVAITIPAPVLPMELVDSVVAVALA